MYYNGLVVKKTSNYSIVLTDTNEYYRIKNKANIKVTSKILFLEEDIIKNSREIGTMSTLKKFAMVASLILCLTLTMIIVPKLPSETIFALVSVDINPSIDITVSKNSTVIELIPLNEMAKEVINKEMVGKELTEVINDIILMSQELNYLSDSNNNVLISCASLEENNIDALSNSITDYIKNDSSLNKDLIVIYLESDPLTAKQSLEEKISLGKLEVSHLTHIDEAKELSVKEMLNNKAIGDVILTKVVIEDEAPVIEIENENETLLKEIDELLEELSYFSITITPIQNFLFKAKTELMLESPNYDALIIEAKELIDQYSDEEPDDDSDIDSDEEDLEGDADDENNDLDDVDDLDDQDDVNDQDDYNNHDVNNHDDNNNDDNNHDDNNNDDNNHDDNDHDDNNHDDNDHDNDHDDNDHDDNDHDDNNHNDNNHDDNNNDDNNHNDNNHDDNNNDDNNHDDNNHNDNNHDNNNDNNHDDNN